MDYELLPVTVYAEMFVLVRVPATQFKASEPLQFNQEQERSILSSGGSNPDRQCDGAGNTPGPGNLANWFWIGSFFFSLSLSFLSDWVVPVSLLGLSLHKTCKNVKTDGETVESR